MKLKLLNCGEVKRIRGTFLCVDEWLWLEYNVLAQISVLHFYFCHREHHRSNK